MAQRDEADVGKRATDRADRCQRPEIPCAVLWHVLVAQMEAIGGSPQKMAFSEVYGALQQGVVDGQENTWSNIYGKKFFEVQDGVTQTDHGIIDYLLVTNIDWLNGLPNDVRSQFLNIVGEVTQTRNAESTAVNDAAKQAIIAGRRHCAHPDRLHSGRRGSM